MEHIAGIEDYQVALTTYRAAVERWPGTPITLRQGARVLEDSRRLRLTWSDKGQQGELNPQQCRPSSWTRLTKLLPPTS